MDPVPLVEYATLPLYESSSLTEKENAVALRKKGLDPPPPPPPPPPQEAKVSVIDVTKSVLKNEEINFIVTL